MEPIVLFGIQFTLSLLVYALLASWYVVPRLASVPKELALVPLLWSLCSGSTRFASSGEQSSLPAPPIQPCPQTSGR